MSVSRDRALVLLTECTGDDIWSIEHCRARRVPESWIAELSDAFESGFQNDRQTIYVGEKQVNQYHGIRDVDLAIKLAGVLGIDIDRITATAISRQAIVREIKEAMME